MLPTGKSTSPVELNRLSACESPSALAISNGHAVEHAEVRPSLPNPVVPEQRHHYARALRSDTQEVENLTAIRELLVSLARRIGVENAVEVLLDEVQRSAYVAGFKAQVPLYDWPRADAVANDCFRAWQHEDAEINRLSGAAEANRETEISRYHIDEDNPAA